MPRNASTFESSPTAASSGSSPPIAPNPQATLPVPLPEGGARGGFANTRGIDPLPSPRTSSSTIRPASFSSSRFSTRAVRAGVRPAGPNAPLVAPLVQSTAYAQDSIGCSAPHAYSRVSNPSVSALEEQLGALENAPPAVCFGTGLAAETALFLSLLKSGDHAVVAQAVYGGTVRLFRQILSGLGISATFVDATNPALIRAAITAHTRLIFIETPANPTLVLTDIAVVAQIAREANIPLAVDNTFLTPALQQPLDLGADISVYSTTKHIEGHAIAIGGAITSRDTDLLTRLRFIRKSTGSIQAAFQAWLTINGIRTLDIRIQRHSESAHHIAQWLETHPLISRVNYPGLESFPQHDLAQRQHLGLHGGILSFELVGGIEAARNLAQSVQLCTLAEHVGAIETLLTHPATMTHADVPPEQRRAAGIPDGLLRLSVGLEDPADILADLEKAIERAHEQIAIVEPVAARTERSEPCLSR